LANSSARAADWPQWRGPAGDGKVEGRIYLRTEHRLLGVAALPAGS
jgi:hypothetical protein